MHHVERAFSSNNGGGGDGGDRDEGSNQQESSEGKQRRLHHAVAANSLFEKALELGRAQPSLCDTYASFLDKWANDSLANEMEGNFFKGVDDGNDIPEEDSDVEDDAMEVDHDLGRNRRRRSGQNAQQHTLQQRAREVRSRSEAMRHRGHVSVMESFRLSAMGSSTALMDLSKTGMLTPAAAVASMAAKEQQKKEESSARKQQSSGGVDVDGAAAVRRSMLSGMDVRLETLRHRRSGGGNSLLP